MSIPLGAGKGASGWSFWPTLIGAVVGGTVSLATTLLVERQRSRREADEYRRRLLADARLAGRVIGLELSDVKSVLRVAIQQTPFRWPPSSGYELPLTAWSEYSARLGAAVSDEVWNEVALPYSSFGFANLLGSVTATTAQTMLAETEGAIKALESWASAASVRNV